MENTGRSSKPAHPTRSLNLQEAMKRKRIRRVVAVAAFAIGILFVSPCNVRADSPCDFQADDVGLPNGMSNSLPLLIRPASRLEEATRWHPHPRTLLWAETVRLGGRSLGHGFTLSEPLLERLDLSLKEE